ncbi:unnamed protein product [Sphagnum tenellum]
MKHPNILLLEKIYSDFAKNDLDAVLAACANQITFQVPGKSKLSGKFDKKTFGPGVITPLQELSGGTFKMEVHDILASDRHGLVLVTHQLVRDNKTIELRAVHVWRIEAGRLVAWYEYPRDLYQFDLIWS